MSGRIPNLRIVVFFCMLAALGYGGFSIYVVGWSHDEAMTGDVIGTWKSFAVAAFAFWLGSSSGGKARAADPPEVEVVNTAANPVPTTTERN